MKGKDRKMGPQNAPDTEAVEFKGVILAITSSFGVSKSIGIWDADRGRDMVSKALSN